VVVVVVVLLLLLLLLPGQGSPVCQTWGHQ
jgi:hypothetical protein